MHSFSFFFNDPPPTEIYTLSLHDALPISTRPVQSAGDSAQPALFAVPSGGSRSAGKVTVKVDRKSTRLNSSHRCISYAVFCLKKKKNKKPKQIVAKKREVSTLDGHSTQAE